MKKVASEVAKEVTSEKQGWFEHSREWLQPLVAERNYLLSQARVTHSTDDF